MATIHTPLRRDDLVGWVDPPVWGMVHLLPLPGSPAYAGDASEPMRRAVVDVERLVEAGFGAVVVENYGDTPFYGDVVPPITVAAMTRVAAQLRERWPELRLAINCLRNDARSAISVASAVEADAIRVNVHVGATLTDQGVITGRAAETLRLRRELGAPVRILADVQVKHAAPLAPRSMAEEVSDLRLRGQADVILITGSGTGRPADPKQVTVLREALPTTPLFVASGVTADSARIWAPLVDGAIVGSALMRGGRAGAGVDADRARAILEAWMAARDS